MEKDQKKNKKEKIKCCPISLGVALCVFRTERNKALGRVVVVVVCVWVVRRVFRVCVRRESCEYGSIVCSRWCVCVCSRW